jgi:hypothetical protein
MLSRDELIRTLRERLEQATARCRSERVSSGSAGLDRLLPGRGFRRGTLTEWLSEPGGGATTMALVSARAACCLGGALVVVDRSPASATNLGGRFYPPAAAALGIDLEKLILVRPTHARDERWALTQALGCQGVAAVLCWPEKFDSRSLRRMQLAAEQGGSLGLLVGPPSSTTATWSEVRLRVEGIASPGPRRLRIELLRSRSGGEMRTHEGRSIELEIGEEGQIHETSPLHLVPSVAPAAAGRRAARA